jgi:hypothetical protein
MIKMTNSLIALSFLGVLSLAVTSPALAKTKASKARAKSPSYQYSVRRPVLVAPVAPIVRCPYGGVWDAYGLRCDDAANTR